ncbi:MAG: DUF333 domain-containing protein [Acidobacteriaceae bacterium]
MKTSLLVVMCCLLLSACTQANSQLAQTATPISPTIEPTMSTLPNPASAFCEQQGYVSVIRTASDGSQSGVCVFPDGSECDEWAFFRSECLPAASGGSLPNPASVFCEQQGYTLQIRTAEDGSQRGVCVFPDGSECDEWAYFQAECKPAEEEAEYDSQGWKIFTEETLGYSFHYPPDVQVVISDEPKRALSLEGSGLGSESWSVAHPQNMAEYRPPQDADLWQWLSDHNMLGEERLADEQIAGTTAIHFRHAASPQSYAFDSYFFAQRGQLYLITIGHASNVEDWELNNRFLQSFQFDLPFSPPYNPTAIPAALPIDPGAYQDWITYTHSIDNFSLRLPNDWIVEEVSGGGPGMDGHLLNLHSMDAFHQESIRLTFRQAGEDTPLWPTGVGQGEFIPAGSLDIAGEPAQRMLLVCPTGEITSIWYHQAEDQPNLPRGGLEFGFLFSASPTHCLAGNSLSRETQLVGEMIIASLSVP